MCRLSPLRNSAKVGELIAFDETSLTILVGKADRRIPRDEIRKVKTFRQSLGVGLWIAVVGSCIQLGTNIWALRAPEGEIRNPGQLGTALATRWPRRGARAWTQPYRLRETARRARRRLRGGDTHRTDRQEVACGRGETLGDSS